MNCVEYAHVIEFDKIAKDDKTKTQQKRTDKNLLHLLEADISFGYIYVFISLYRPLVLVWDNVILRIFFTKKKKKEEKEEKKLH